MTVSTEAIITGVVAICTVASMFGGLLVQSRANAKKLEQVSGRVHDLSGQMADVKVLREEMAALREDVVRIEQVLWRMAGRPVAREGGE